MNRNLIRHGFILAFLALVTGMLVPGMPLPRLGLAAHTIGMLSGTLLIAIGAIWQQFRLSPGQQAMLSLSWLYSSYINWLGCLVGAVSGAGRTTPLAAAGATGSPLAENLVAIMLISVALVSFLAVGLSLWGLRGQQLTAREN